MSFLAIEKDRPEENAGVIVRRGASLGVWEYSEMSQEARHLLRDGRQRLCYGVKRAGTVQLIAAETLLPTDVLVPREALPRWESLGLQYQYGAINPNIVVVSLDSVVRNGREVPPHLALKGCRHIDHQGQPGPASARFLKLEAFLFDGENDGAVVLEAREKCFAPTKNAEGPIDSPESARRLMHTAAVARLEGLGWEISKDRETWVELSGVLELEDAALAKVVGRGGKVGRGARLSLHGLDIRLGDGLELEPESSLVVDVSSVASLPAAEPQFELPSGHRIRSGESLRRRLTASSHPGGRMGAGAGLG
jgi:hypothetical protein